MKMKARTMPVAVVAAENRFYNVYDEIRRLAGFFLWHFCINLPELNGFCEMRDRDFFRASEVGDCSSDF